MIYFSHVPSFLPFLVVGWGRRSLYFTLAAPHPFLHPSCPPSWSSGSGLDSMPGQGSWAGEVDGRGAAPLTVRARNLEMMGRSCRSSRPTSLSFTPAAELRFYCDRTLLHFFPFLFRGPAALRCALSIRSLCAPVLALFSRSSLHTFNRSRAFSEPQSCLAAEAA